MEFCQPNASGIETKSYLPGARIGQIPIGTRSAYGRVSTGQQTTENQRLELTQAGYQIEPDYWFADETVSGKVATSQRPAFKRMLGKITDGVGRTNVSLAFAMHGGGYASGQSHANPSAIGLAINTLA